MDCSNKFSGEHGFPALIIPVNHVITNVGCGNPRITSFLRQQQLCFAAGEALLCYLLISRLTLYIPLFNGMHFFYRCAKIMSQSMQGRKARNTLLFVPKFALVFEKVSS